MLVYGQPGIGKSTMALSAPNPVLFDFDGGVQRVNVAFQCPTLQVKNWEEALQALEELKSGEVPCSTIIIDTAGKMLDFMSDFIMRNDSKMRMRDGSLSLKGYGARKVMFVNFLREVAMMGKNIVFVAHEREDKDGETKIVRPEIGGSSAGDLMKELDLVGYVQAVGSDRTVYWTPQEKFYAKNTCNLPAWQKIPVIVDEKGNVTQANDTLQKVFTYYEANVKKIEETRKRYNELLEEIEMAIENITDAKSANEFAKAIGTTEIIWDSKVRARELFKAKVEQLKLKWDAKSKTYEDAAA
jgi:chaperonin cofactor prefoldin